PSALMVKRALGLSLLVSARRAPAGVSVAAPLEGASGTCISPPNLVQVQGPRLGFVVSIGRPTSQAGLAQPAGASTGNNQMLPLRARSQTVPVKSPMAPATSAVPLRMPVAISVAR